MRWSTNVTLRIKSGILFGLKIFIKITVNVDSELWISDSGSFLKILTSIVEADKALLTVEHTMN